MIAIKRTDSTDADFVYLVKFLDAELAMADGADHAFYAQFNKIAKIKHVLVAYLNGQPIGCGAIKQFDDTAMEVKRMYCLPEYRGQGIASTILLALEDWAYEQGFAKTVLETGKRQPEAIALYLKKGYIITSNYGQYVGVDNSVCFEKLLSYD